MKLSYYFKPNWYATPRQGQDQYVVAVRIFRELRRQIFSRVCSIAINQF